MPPPPSPPPWHNGCALIHGEGDCSESNFCTAPTNGECLNGLCNCHPGFIGNNCSVEVLCRYWDDELEDWSTEGVTPAPPPGGVFDGFLHCDALHLTDFGGVAIPSDPDALLESLTPTFTTFTMDEMFAILSDFDFGAYPGLTATIFGMLGLNIITLFLLGCWRGHRKYTWRKNADELNESEQLMEEIKAAKLESLVEATTTFGKLRRQVLVKGFPSLVDDAQRVAQRRFSQSIPTSKTAIDLAKLAAKPVAVMTEPAVAVIKGRWQHANPHRHKSIDSTSIVPATIPVDAGAQERTPMKMAVKLNARSRLRLSAPNASTALSVVPVQTVQEIEEDKRARKRELMKRERVQATAELAQRSTRHMMCLSSVGFGGSGTFTGPSEERTVQERLVRKREVKTCGIGLEPTQGLTVHTRAPRRSTAAPKLATVSTMSPLDLLQKLEPQQEQPSRPAESVYVLQHRQTARSGIITPATRPIPTTVGGVAQLAPGSQASLLAAKVRMRQQNQANASGGVTIQERITCGAPSRQVGARGTAAYGLRSSAVRVLPNVASPDVSSPPLSPPLSPPSNPIDDDGAMGSMRPPQLPPSARRAAELKAAGAKLKTLSLAARVFEAQKVAEGGALVVLPDCTPPFGASSSGQRPSADCALPGQVRSGTCGAPRPRVLLQATMNSTMASSRILPHGAHAAEAQAPAPDAPSPLSAKANIGVDNQKASEAKFISPTKESMAAHLKSAGVKLSAADKIAKTHSPPLKRNNTRVGLTRAPTALLKWQATSLKRSALATKDNVVNWRPPSGRTIKDGVKQFWSNFTTGFRSDHTLVSFISPSDDDEALNDMQVVQLFWSTLMIDLYFNCANTAPPNRDAAPPDPDAEAGFDIINTLSNGIFTASGTVFIVLCLRAIFRWSNNRRIPEKKRGGLTKLIKEGGLTKYICKVFAVINRERKIASNKCKKMKKPPPTREEAAVRVQATVRGSKARAEVALARAAISRSDGATGAARNLLAAAPAQSALDSVREFKVDASPPPSPPSALPAALHGEGRRASEARNEPTECDGSKREIGASPSQERKGRRASAWRQTRLSPEKQRTVVITKAAGSPTGIGLQANEGRLTVAYVEEDSIFAGLIAAGEQLISINGNAVNASTVSDREHAALLLHEASDLSVVVRETKLTQVAAPAAASSMALIVVDSSQVRKLSGDTTAAKNDQQVRARADLQRTRTSSDLRPKTWQRHFTVNTRDMLKAVAAAESASPDGRIDTKQVNQIKALMLLRRKGKESKDTRVKEKFKELRVRSDGEYFRRQAFAWFMNWLTYVWIGFTVFIYAGLHGPETTASIVEGWFASLFMALGMIEPFNIFMIALLPVILSEQGCLYKCYSICFYVYNEYIA